MPVSNVRLINLHILILMPFLFRVLYAGGLVKLIISGSREGYLFGFLNEVFVASIVVGFLYLSCLIRVVWISYLIRLLVLSVLLFLLADLAVLKNFYSRLNVFDIAIYYRSVMDYVISSFSWISQLLVVVVIALLIVVVFRFKVNRQQLRWQVFLIFPVVAVSAKVFSLAGERYVEAWIYRDALTYNLDVASERKTYSPAFEQSFTYVEPVQCEQVAIEEEPLRQPNIILLMVESLSSYQSQLFSGLNNWTPQVDRIAQENTYFTEFYASGFATVDGEISLLLGELPLFAPAVHVEPGQSSLAGFYNRQSALPRLLAPYGYVSEFYTTSTLTFSDTGNWARSLGFDHVEGGEYPGYNELPRFHFKSVEDRFLFARVQARLEELDKDPYFLFIKTVSTHHPFVEPISRRYSEEGAFRYVDKQVGQFYDYLKAADFFDDGLLLIVGDHRAMTPIDARERELMGSLRAPAKVPFIVVGESDPERESGMYQQSDIYQAIKSRVTGEYCWSDWLGDLWQRRPAKYILHRRGDRRNRLSIFVGDKDVVVKLAGDKTRVVKANDILRSEQQAILNKIHSVRLRRTVDGE